MIRSGSLRKQGARLSYNEAALVPAQFQDSDAYWDFTLRSLTSQRGGLTLINTRTGPATFRGGNGLIQTAADNLPRWQCDFDGNVEGLLQESGARTNLLWPSRDFTHARWVKTNVTAAKDQVGVDGAANSASSLTADANGGTVTQSLTSTSAHRLLSFDMKRLVGSGTVEISTNGTTFTDVTALLTAGPFDVNGYVRVHRAQAAHANPVVTIRFGTSGDKIAIDAAGLESDLSTSVTARPTSRIFTTTAAVTRAAESTTVVISSYNTVATLYVRSRSHQTGGVIGYLPAQIDGASNTERSGVFYEPGSESMSAFTVDGGALQSSINLTPAAVGAFHKIAYATELNNAAASLNGATPVADTSLTMPTVTVLRLGTDVTNAAGLNDVVSHVGLWKRRLTNTELQAL